MGVRARAAALILVLETLAGAPSMVAAKEAVTWEKWRHIAGIFDVYSTPGNVFLATTDGKVSQFSTSTSGARIVPTFNQPVLKPNDESYIAASAGMNVDGAGCSFARDDVWAIHPTGPSEVDELAQSKTKVAISGVESLNGIVFDTSGAFGHRLLVTGPKKGKTVVIAIDCKGGEQVITSSAPAVEGGLAVAPASFRLFPGGLIAPDENSGKIWAIKPDGSSVLIYDSSGGSAMAGVDPLPKGGDLGVESAGFVPDGFFENGGWAYLADRATPGNPHPGTDSLLRLSSDQLRQGGAADGDLVVATEGGAQAIALNCSLTQVCIPRNVVTTGTTSHGEGHIAFAMGGPNQSPVNTSPAANLPGERAASGVSWPAIVVGTLLVVAIAAAVSVFLRRRVA